MDSTMTRITRRLIAVAGAATVLAAGAPPAAAQLSPADSVTLTPTQDTAPAGTCNEFTARLTGFEGRPERGLMVDVRQVLQSPGTEPGETRELAFCNPTNPNGPNPTGQGDTVFADVYGNNPGSAPSEPGRHTDVHGEVGPTDANGEVTFGITINHADLSGAQVTVTAWWEGDNDDVLEENEPRDISTKQWVASEERPVVSLDASPETATRPNGGQHEVSVTVMTAMGPAVGVTPASLVLPNAGGRPAGDVADPLAGPSPNAPSGQAKPAVYSCTPSNAQGVSTCRFQDPAGTPAGTDTVVFFVDEGGPQALDEGDPQDAIQVAWSTFQPQPDPPTPTPTPTPSPTPTPGPGMPGARNVRLCHDTAGGTSCDTAPRDLMTGDDHFVAALVTDRNGNPLQGVPVQFRISGQGSFQPGGTTSVLVTTSSSGVAIARLTSELDGSSSIVAEISPPGTAGSSRGPGANDDECEQPAGAGGFPAAGNCVSQVLVVSWESEIDGVDCDDGMDNDGDGLVDYGEDPGCTDDADGSEEPFNGHPIEPERHTRRVNMRFRDPVGPGDGGLVIFGRLRLAEEGDDFHGCTQGQPVRIQRRRDGDWKTIETVATDDRGRYTGAVADRTGRYRAVAGRTEVTDDLDVLHICRKATIAKRHRHRG